MESENCMHSDKFTIHISIKSTTVIEENVSTNKYLKAFSKSFNDSVVGN